MVPTWPMTVSSMAKVTARPKRRYVMKHSLVRGRASMRCPARFPSAAAAKTFRRSLSAFRRIWTTVGPAAAARRRVPARMVEVRREVRPEWPFRLPGGGPDGVLRRRGGVRERLLHVGDDPAGGGGA